MTLDKTLLAWTTSKEDWENSMQDPFWSSGRQFFLCHNSDQFRWFFEYLSWLSKRSKFSFILWMNLYRPAMEPVQNQLKQTTPETVSQELIC